MSEFWRDSAACLDMWQEIWFPVGNGPDAQLQTQEAKAICRGCPVVESCLSWALDNGPVAGVWGALSEEERRQLRKRTQRAALKARNRAGESVVKPRDYPVRGVVGTSSGTRRIS